MTDTLHTAIDAAGQALLERANGKGEDGFYTLTIEEQVKAFVAVSKWAEIKHTIAPPPPPETKNSRFENIKGEFHGKRRGRPPANRTLGSDGVAAASEADTTYANGRAATADEAGPGDRVAEPASH